jgi:hypothetical protein
MQSKIRDNSNNLYVIARYFKKLNKLNPLALFEKNAQNDSEKNLVPEVTSILFFMFHITVTIEIMNGYEHKESIFPILPECFMLDEVYKLKFMENVAVLDSNQKMTDLMENFDVFNITMNAYLEFFRNSPK